MPTLLLVRHAVSAAEPGRYWGSSDPPLAQLGRDQALALAQRLADQALTVAYTSDLRRAVGTAEPLLNGRSTTLLRRAELRELDFGLCEGLTYPEALARYPGSAAFFAGEHPEAALPGGEGLVDLTARVQRFLDEVAALPADDSVLVVGHGGSLRILLCLALGLGPAQQWRWRLDHTSLSILSLSSGKARLDLLNDCCHLATLAPTASR